MSPAVGVRRRGGPPGGTAGTRSGLAETVRRGREKCWQVLTDPQYTALLGVCLCVLELGVTHWVIQRVPCE